MPISKGIKLGEWELINSDTVYFADTAVEITTYGTGAGTIGNYIYSDTFNPPTTPRVGNSSDVGGVGVSCIIPRGNYYKVTYVTANPTIYRKKLV